MSLGAAIQRITGASLTEVDFIAPKVDASRGSMGMLPRKILKNRVATIALVTFLDNVLQFVALLTRKGKLKKQKTHFVQIKLNFKIFGELYLELLT